MMSRFLTVLVAALALALPVAAQSKPKGPALTFQTLPAGKLLADIRTAAKAFGGDAAVKDLDKTIKDALGEKGLTGLDLQKPIVGYADFSDKAEEFGGVFLAPITDEKEFLELLKRVNLTALEVKDSPGLYQLLPSNTPTGEQPAKAPARLRFKDRFAYIATNLPDSALAPDKLIPFADLVVQGETAALTYRVHLDRVPASLKKQGFDAVDALVMEANNAPVPDAAKTVVKDLAKLLKRMTDATLTEGDFAAVRVRLDPQTTEAALEVALAPKPGTQLAKDIAARKPTTNRFAGLITADAVASGVIQAPLFAPEIRDAAAAGLETMAAEIRKSDPPPPEFKELFDEAVAGITRTLKSGELDAAVVMTGPDKDGAYSVAGAISYDKTAGLEKVLRGLHANAPNDVKNLFTLDAAKVGEVAIHEAVVGPFLPPEAKKVFGTKASVCLAFAPDGIFVTFGPDAVAAMKTALAVKRGEAKAFDIQINPAKLQKLIAAMDPEGGKKAAEILGSGTKLESVFHATIEGGTELRLRVALPVKLFPRAAATTGTTTEKGFEPIPPVVEKKK